jgi:hypothetical protein
MLSGRPARHPPTDLAREGLGCLPAATFPSVRADLRTGRCHEAAGHHLDRGGSEAPQFKRGQRRRRMEASHGPCWHRGSRRRASGSGRCWVTSRGPGCSSSHPRRASGMRACLGQRMWVSRARESPSGSLPGPRGRKRALGNYAAPASTPSSMSIRGRPVPTRTNRRTRL